MPGLLRNTLLALLLGAAGACHGQAPLNEPMTIVPRAEAESLRRVLATPAPAKAGADELRRYFSAAMDAARRLADPAARRRIAAEAIQRLPDDARWYNEMAIALREGGAWEQSRRYQEQAVERARDPAQRLFYQSNLVGWLVLRSAPEAAAQLAATRSAAEDKLADAALTRWQRVLVLRALAQIEGMESVQRARRGRIVEQLDSAALAERQARAALDIVLADGAQLRGELRAAATDLAYAQKVHAAALRRLERDAEAEAVLLAHFQTIQQFPVGADFAAGAHAALAALRLDQREFGAAERQLRLSLKVLDALGAARGASQRTEKIAELALVIWVQGRRDEALAEFEALDREVGPVADAAFRMRHAFARGVVLLGAGRADEAAALLAESVRARQHDFGAGHFNTALAEGLQGAALWAGRDAAARERGAELLKQAVLDLHAPRNADYLNDRGLRRALLQRVFDAHVQAMAARGGLPALWAMGVADDLRGGVTAAAMAESAVRAAAADPELAALVRQEQDARRELRAAEALLQSQEPDEVLSDDAAQRLRARVGEVEVLRQQLQQRIRERFPGYDRIVRPPLPNPADVALRLARGEAFLMFMPTERALLAWFITADELPQFKRVEIGAAELRGLVLRVRRALDFSGGRPQPFDRAAAQALYRHLIGPFETPLGAQRQIVITASGALAMLPFATLQGSSGSDAQPAWLASRWALVQVPSVSAWLALRQVPRAPSAAEPMFGWGDPNFSRAAARADLRHAVSGGRAAVAASGAAPRYEDLPPLPETRDEVLAIAAALEANPARDLFLGTAATRESLMQANRSGELARKRVLVFATHGLMAGDLPGLKQPALALAAPAAGDPAAGLLTLDDVLGLKLNADWVVLSACNTAAGDGRGEEALSGLARGFFYAGSRSLLVTQWAVETESAKLLTTATFEHHARERGAGKAESLRQAMLQVMANPRYSHPAFWAPYMLVGDGGR